MSEALEALEKLAQRQEVVIERTGWGMTFPKKRLDECLPELFATIRAALEQGEAVATVTSFTFEGSGESAKHLYIHEEIERLPDGTKLYTAPPSTAEAQARALIGVASRLLEVRMSDALNKDSPAQLEALQSLRDAGEVLAKVINELSPVHGADAEAKRIREER